MGFIFAPPKITDCCGRLQCILQVHRWRCTFLLLYLSQISFWVAFYYIYKYLAWQRYRSQGFGCECSYCCCYSCWYGGERSKRKHRRHRCLCHMVWTVFDWCGSASLLPLIDWIESQWVQGNGTRKSLENHIVLKRNTTCNYIISLNQYSVKWLVTICSFNKRQMVSPSTCSNGILVILSMIIFEFNATWIVFVLPEVLRRKLGCKINRCGCLWIFNVFLTNYVHCIRPSSHIIHYLSLDHFPNFPGARRVSWSPQWYVHCPGIPVFRSPGVCTSISHQLFLKTFFVLFNWGVLIHEWKWLWYFSIQWQ